MIGKRWTSPFSIEMSYYIAEKWDHFEDQKLTVATVISSY